MACIAIQTILNRYFDFFRVSDLAQRSAISIADIQVTTHPVITVIYHDNCCTCTPQIFKKTYTTYDIGSYYVGHRLLS